MAMTDKEKIVQPVPHGVPCNLAWKDPFSPAEVANTPTEAERLKHRTFACLEKLRESHFQQLAKEPTHD